MRVRAILKRELSLIIHFFIFLYVLKLARIQMRDKYHRAWIL